MPGLLQKNAQFGAGSVSSNGIWSKPHVHVTFDQLRKFWSELSLNDRQTLLRIDKQTLFEQARKNLYCSRCNGLLLEGFSQIVMYGKSLQQEGAGVRLPSKSGALKNQIDSGLRIISSSCQDDMQDPSVHPWGGLIATRDGILTLLDCFLDGASLEALQNVFDNARARERERELLYPDACGGGGRGWISQGMASYGRGHGNRETCALHTARLSCDTLVDFWSALGDETRQSLLRMKEEDFIERLMYRFESKRFCRDCRRNVIREFKELKELKRMRRETRCTNWFCVADTAFQYEVSDDTVQADWHQSFTDAVGTYHHFEWALGTGEGKSDILEFEDVGTYGSVQANGLDLGGLSGCFITLRAWKLDGRCSEFTVKAHALKGQPCVHRRLIVGDGFVTITKGESIRSFFEHAEETEEEEDDDSVDKDGNELDGDGPRSQKHAKSPELAREFLLDAATVIFKEQVEKAFREGTARQNAHSIFVCLALKFLEERIHVACKEIITLEKQIKLLEEEEREKREEEERKERRRAKEREKKLRRKERLKEKEREKNCIVPKELPIASQMAMKELRLSAQEEPRRTSNSGDLISESGDIMPVSPISSDILDEENSNGCTNLQNLENDSICHPCDAIEEIIAIDGNGSFMIEQSKSFRWKSRFRKESLADTAPRWCDGQRFISGKEGGCQVDECDTKLHGYTVASSRCFNEPQRQSRNNPVKHNGRSCGPKFNEKLHCSNNQIRDKYDLHSCCCNSHADYRSNGGRSISMIRSGRDLRIANKSVSALDIPRPFYHRSKHNQGSYTSESCGVPNSKFVSVKIPRTRDLLYTKKVWEPTESRKRYPRSDSDQDATSASSASNLCNGNGNGSLPTNNILNAFDEAFSSELSGNLGIGGDLNNCQSHEGDEVGFQPIISNFPVNNASDPLMSTSSSDSCPSCLSEGDSSAQIARSSSTSDSENTSQQSEGRENSTCSESPLQNCPDVAVDGKCKTNGQAPIASGKTTGCLEASFIGGNVSSSKIAHSSYNGRVAADTGSQQCHMLPVHNQSIHLPVFPAPSPLGYYHPSPPWAAAPTNGLVPFPQSNHYMYPNSLGYGLSTNHTLPFCMQYGALQTSTTPMLTVSQLPFYQTGSKANVVNSKVQTKNSVLGGTQEAISVANTVSSEHSLKRPFPNQQSLQKTPPAGQDGSAVDPGRSHNDGSTFSLFHFGGPVAVAAAENNSNPVSLKDGVVEDFSSKLPVVGPDQDDLSGTKRDTSIEEYSLFSARNGVRFSFF